MLIAAVENFVLFSTLFMLATFGVACTAKYLVKRKLWRPHPHTLSWIYTTAVWLPPAAAVWLVSAALLPQSWLGSTGFDTAHPAPVHQIHLLGALTTQFEPTLYYMMLSCAAFAVLFAAWSSVRNTMRVGDLVKRLEMGTTSPPPGQLALVEEVTARHGLDVGLVMSSYPFAFMWGVHRSKLILSSGLLCALTAEELEGVLEHEAAHHRRRDNLAKLVLSVCSYTTLAVPLSRLILRWRAAEVELICDEVAAARTEAPLDIADALVKMQRQNPHFVGFTATAAAASEFNGGAQEFKWRVCRLISIADTLPASARVDAMSQMSWVGPLAVLSVFTTTLIGTSVFAPYAVHSVVEALIRLIS